VVSAKKKAGDRSGPILLVALPDLGDGLSFIDQFEAECEDRHVAFGVESDDLGVLGQ